MRKYFASVLTAAALLAGPAALADSPVTADTKMPPPAVVSAHPVIWHVKGGKGTVTLFGSLHILPANMDWLTPEVMRAVSRADVFVFEVPTDPSSQDALNALIASHGSLPAGQSLRDLLPADYQTQYDSAVTAARLSPSVTDHEQPWLVSLQLSLADTMNRNYYPDAGADYVLMSWANGHARPVRYLETIDQQFALLTPPDGNLKLDALESGLKTITQAQDPIAPLVSAWSDGDVARLGALMDANFASNPEAKKRLLTDRNHQWAAQIETMLREDKTIFITVGAAHMAGPDGVPALLRKDGFVVEGP